MYGFDLETLQKSAKQYEGGTYYDMNGYCFYVPENVDSSTAAFVYYPGSGGAGNDAKYLRELIANGKPNQIMVIADTYPGDNKYGASYFQLIENIGKENGAEISNINSMCFSASGGSGYNTFVNLVNTYPDDKHSVVFCDVVSFNVKQEHIDAFKENDSTLIFLELQGQLMSQTATLAKNGVDVIVGRTTGSHNGHVPLNADIIKGGIVAFMSGEATELTNKDIYSFERYDSETGKWVSMSFEEVAAKFEGSYDPSDPFRYYSKLSSIKEVQSNNEFIESKVNIIRNIIRNTNFLSATSFETYESTTNIPNAEAEVVQSFFTSCADMLYSLEKDTRAIAKIGNDIKALDQELASKGEELNQSVVNENVTSTTQNTGSTNIIYSENASSSNGNNYTGSYSNNNTGGSNNVGSTNNGVNSIAPSVGTGVGSVIIDNTNKEENNNTINKIDEELEKLVKDIKEELLEYDELYSDDKKLVFNNNDEYKVVVHYKDDKVLTLEYYFNFENESQATTSMELLKKEFADSIEDVVQEGQYVKAIFKEELFEDLTLKEIREEYKDLEELIKKEEK